MILFSYTNVCIKHKSNMKKPKASAEIEKMPFGDQKAFHLLNTTRNQFFLPYYYNSNLLQRKLKLLLAIFSIFRFMQ